MRFNYGPLHEFAGRRVCNECLVRRTLRSEEERSSCSATATAAPEPGDELGAYTRQELIRMDVAFCEAMERAISRGLERRPQDKARAA